MSEIKEGMEIKLTDISPRELRCQLRRFGLMEGMHVVCRMAGRTMVALQWPGTTLALRRRDLTRCSGRVILWTH